MPKLGRRKQFCPNWAKTFLGLVHETCPTGCSSCRPWTCFWIWFVTSTSTFHYIHVMVCSLSRHLLTKLAYLIGSSLLTEINSSHFLFLQTFCFTRRWNQANVSPGQPSDLPQSLTHLISVAHGKCRGRFLSSRLKNGDIKFWIRVLDKMTT